MTKIPLRVFVLGALITAFYAMLPVGVLVWNWVHLWQDMPDMRIMGPQLITCAGLGLWAFWQKYKAWLELPPTWARAVELAQQVRVATVETVEQKGVATKVTTTVATTETSNPKPQEPQV